MLKLYARLAGKAIRLALRGWPAAVVLPLYAALLQIGGGLLASMGDAVKAMIGWCNAQGGILGRKIVGDFYDGALTLEDAVMQQACKTDFMLVGEGFALDDSAEQTRVGCDLAAVPGSSFFFKPAEGATLIRFCFCKKRETLELTEERLSHL